MIFNNIKDENDTPLSVFAKLLQEKATAAGLISVFVFAAQDGPNQGIHVISNAASSVPVILIGLAEAMLDEAANVTVEKIENKQETIH